MHRLIETRTAQHFTNTPWAWFGVPNGIRTRVLALKGLCPRPLDDGDGQGGLASEPRASTARAWEGVTASTNDAALSVPV